MCIEWNRMNLLSVANVQKSCRKQKYNTRTHTEFRSSRKMKKMVHFQVKVFYNEGKLNKNIDIEREYR